MSTSTPREHAHERVVRAQTVFSSGPAQGSKPVRQRSTSGPSLPISWLSRHLREKRRVAQHQCSSDNWRTTLDPRYRGSAGELRARLNGPLTGPLDVGRAVVAVVR